jgi:hypothetical protein
MFLDLLDLHIPILHVPLDSWLGMIRNKRQRTDEFRECTTNGVRGQTVKYVIDKAPTIVLRNSPSIANEDVFGRDWLSFPNDSHCQFGQAVIRGQTANP